MDEVYGEGFHVIWPWDRMYVYNVRIQKASREIQVLTRKGLKVQWQDGPHASFESEAFKKQMMATARQAAKVAHNVGNVDAEFAKGGKVLEAMYYTPLAAHASMEPPAAVAEFQDGKVTVWEFRSTRP